MTEWRTDMPCRRACVSLQSPAPQSRCFREAPLRWAYFDNGFVTAASGFRGDLLLGPVVTRAAFAPRIKEC
jgi:hypothetical protein